MKNINVLSPKVHQSPETNSDFRAGIESVISLRCTRHLGVPPLNRNEFSGGECGACIAKEKLAAARLWFFIGVLVGGFAALAGVLWR